MTKSTRPSVVRQRPAGPSLLLGLSLSLSLACSEGSLPPGEPVVTTRAGALAWKLWLTPDPPRQKGTVLWLEVSDARGERVADAEVKLGYLMPAMGAMAEMRGRGEASEVAPGRYRVELDFPMAGSWTIDLEVKSARGAAAAEYALTTGTRGLRQLDARITRAAAADAETIAPYPPAAGDDIAHYTCSMHPSVEHAHPGTCPICAMDLTPVTREEVETGVIRVDAARRQQIGVRTAQIEVRPLTVTVRTVGTVTYDETRLVAVSLKNRGWIERLFVDETGQAVRRGQPLLALYSPELLSAQEELLSALKSQQAAQRSEAPERADYLVEAARRRLALWDLSPEQIDELMHTGKPIEHLPVFSPAAGFVVEKNVIKGAAVEPGQTLYRIAGLDALWLEADVYESDLPLVSVGQEAEVTLPYLPGRNFTGRVSYVYPYLRRDSRTATVRIVLPNPQLELKPGMYADVVLAASRGEGLVVPAEAVLYAGTRRLVFVDLGGGRLQPREVELGVKSGDAYEVLAGLEPGEVVVTSGNFLIAAESRLRSATEKW